jgi:hypothetical protein
MNPKPRSRSVLIVPVAIVLNLPSLLRCSRGATAARALWLEPRSNRF